jgi:hypothetical protein
MPFTHFALFIIFIENKFKRGSRKKKSCPFFTMTMHYTFNLLGKKRKKEKPQQLKGEKYEYPS